MPVVGAACRFLAYLFLYLPYKNGRNSGISQNNSHPNPTPLSSFVSLESNKETIKNYAIVTKSGGGGGKDKRSSEAEAAAVSADEYAVSLSAPPADSATGASSYNYSPAEPQQQPRYADFSSMVTSAQDKIGRSAEPQPGTSFSTFLPCDILILKGLLF